MQGLKTEGAWTVLPDLAKDRHASLNLKIGRRIYNARMRAQMSQKTLGIHSKLTQAQIWDFEHGKTGVKVSYLIRIAAALGVSPSSLIEGLA